jgi:tetratricopeptide (TPR) repeat protein
VTRTSDRNAILSRRARLVALSLAGAGLSLQGGAPPPVQAAPAGESSPNAGASASWKDAPPEIRLAAQDLFRRAQDESVNGSPAGAIELLTQAVSIYPHPKILAALAAAWEQAGRPDRALPVYRRILDDPQTPEAIREEVKVLQAKARSKVSTLQIRAPSSPGLLLLDDEPVSPGEILLLPGKHRLVYRFSEDQKETQESFDLAPGESRSLTLHPRPTFQVCLSPIPPPPPPPVRGGGCGCGSPGAPT